MIWRIYIYIYFLLNTLSGGTRCLVAHKEWQCRLELPKMFYHSGWWLMRAGYRTCFHTLYDEKKIYACVRMCTCERKIYIYIEREREREREICKRMVSRKYFPTSWRSFFIHCYMLGWVEFYAMSTFVGYLMLNPLYTFTLDIYRISRTFCIYHFQMSPSLFFVAQFNGFKYFYFTRIILFTIYQIVWIPLKDFRHCYVIVTIQQ